MSKKIALLFILLISLISPNFANPADSLGNSNITKNELNDSLFQNLYSKGKEGEATLYWSLEHSQYNKVKNIVIRYKKKIHKDKPWNYTEILPSNKVKINIEDLSDNEIYSWEVGVAKDGSDLNAIKSKNKLDDKEVMLWSKSEKFTTERSWGITRFLVLIGSLGLFVFGMKHMSEGLQQAAGGGLRKILSSMTSNRYLGVLSGFLITALVQSSSATTVMTVSFVNAGLLTLMESAGIMMGANIGTTITGWLISVFGFKVSLSSYSLIIIAVGAPFLFLPKNKYKAAANAIIGFAILFMGLGFLKDSVPTLDADSPLIAFFTQFKDTPFLGRVMFVGLGTLVTIIIQSSSAAMALTLTLVLKGVVPFDVGAAMILGENIGTTITAEIASLVGNVHAKRSARIHSLFNIIGVTWMIFFIPFFLKLIAGYLPADPFNITDDSSREAATVALAAFHTTFNVLNVSILIWFVPLLVKLATKTVPSKGDDDEIFKLEYISSGITETPELALLEAKKETAKFGSLVKKIGEKVHLLVNETDEKVKSKLIKKITKLEDITDRMEVEIANYLTKISEGDLSKESSLQIRSLLSIITDLERVGDLFYEMAKDIERKNEENIWFDQEQRNGLNKLFKSIEDAIEIMIENLEGEFDEANTSKAELKEREINEIRNKMRRDHFKSIENGEYNVKAGMIYSNLFATLERIGDHLINVTEAITGKV
jgi:phosphate:Na+ symporter